MADLLIDYDSLDEARGQVALGAAAYVTGTVVAGMVSTTEVPEAVVGSAAVAQAATSAREVCDQAGRALGDSATAVASALAAAVDALKATDRVLATCSASAAEGAR